MTDLFQHQAKLTEEYRSQDLVFHYTSADVAINKILLPARIRLSPRRLANDPLESTAVSLDRGGMFMDRTQYEQFRRRADTVSKRIEKVLNRETRILSFCMHNVGSAGDDYFGMIKPRMWTQYGDGYRGVCLAFRRNALLSQVLYQLGSESVFSDEVSYFSVQQMEVEREAIRSEMLMGMKDADFVPHFLKSYRKQLLFTKHLDYADENEYRVVALSKEKYVHIDIRSSIFGVVFNDRKHFSDHLCTELLNAAGSLDCRAMELDWTFKRVSTLHYSRTTA